MGHVSGSLGSIAGRMLTCALTCLEMHCLISGAVNDRIWMRRSVGRRVHWRISGAFSTIACEWVCKRRLHRLKKFIRGELL